MRQLFAHHGPEVEMMPLNDITFSRYLRARNYDIKKAQAMLEETIAWRKEFQVSKIMNEWQSQLRIENETGKGYVRGYDKEGHAIIYLRPKAENTHDHDWNLRHLVFNLEKAIAAMRGNEPDGVQKLVLLMDYDGYTLSHAPSTKTSLGTLSILQNHYPERLFRAYCINPPWIFNTFYNMVFPFIDPVTKAKVAMVNGSSKKVLQEKLKGNFDLTKIETSVGGLDTRPFNSRVYMDAPFEVDFLTAISLHKSENGDLSVAASDAGIAASSSEVGQESKEEIHSAEPPAKPKTKPQSSSSYFFSSTARRTSLSASRLENLPPAGVHVLVARSPSKNTKSKFKK
jgi:hypothetical protein